eukprot:TRINITY_DN59217_c0_g1_i1.p1 TRINITY_DN59217_c0_g1~~TRINITY_DN59217_c0_g1_i1.p1  ORF type:complete len:599 (+),score=79.80 TRINITY_DN59217_c0_g1_i1:68-1864(+)
MDDKPEEKEIKVVEEPSSAKKDVILSVGTIIKGKWKITGKIGQGAFGETYAGYDLNSSENSQVAIKVERWDNKKMVLKLEVVALKKLQSCPFVVKYISSGRQDDFNFLVMERLGDNLAELRKKAPGGFFSLGTALRLGSQMLDAIEGCHKLAYIHRDIKPSNFVMGKAGDGKSKRCYLIDFGLARKYRMPGGEIRPPRKQAGFRGTARYASINSHQSKELARRDDLWSLFYVLVEFASGALPWRKIKDKDDIGVLKEKHTNVELVKDLPQQFRLFMEHLQTLGYPSNPDYALLRGYLNEMLEAEGVTPTMPYDWELESHPHRPSQHRRRGKQDARNGKRDTTTPRDRSPRHDHHMPNNPPGLGSSTGPLLATGLSANPSTHERAMAATHSPAIAAKPDVQAAFGGVHVIADVYDPVSQDQAASQHTADHFVAASKKQEFGDKSFNETDNEESQKEPKSPPKLTASAGSAAKQGPTTDKEESTKEPKDTTSELRSPIMLREVPTPDRSTDQQENRNSPPALELGGAGGGTTNTNNRDQTKDSLPQQPADSRNVTTLPHHTFTPNPTPHDAPRQNCADTTPATMPPVQRGKKSGCKCVIM